MNNESELALSIRARILPMIEGSNEFFSQLEQTPQRVTAPMQQLAQDPTFQQGLTPRQISGAQAFAGGEDVMEMQDYQAKIKKLRDEIAITMKASEESGHKITTYDLFGMHKKMLTEQAALEDFRGKQMAAIDEMDLPKEKKEFMKEALVVGIKDASAGLDELNPKLKEMVGQMKEGGAAGESLFAMLKQGGYLALLGQTAHTAMDWTLSEARIEAKQLTGFNLTSPMGSYAATEEAKLFKETTERTREDKLIGTIIGAVTAVALTAGTGGIAAPIALAAGGLFGEQMGGMFAEKGNIEDRAKLEADLKYRSESLGKAEQLVQAARGYKIDQYKSQLRFGTEMGGSEMGYSPDEYLALQKDFGSNLGWLDKNLLKDQLAFTRKEGIDPRGLFQFGDFERQTGTQLDFGYLSNVQGKTKELYGPDADNQKIIDVLKDIRETALKQLKAGVDTHDAIKFAVDLPRMVMGEASPYGRAGDFGGITTSAFERFFKPQDLPEKTLLYSALGGKGLFEDKSFWETGADQTHPKGYLMREGQGMFGEGNFGDVMTKTKDMIGGNEKILQGVLANYLKDYPIELQGKIGTLLMGNEVELPVYKRDKKGRIEKDEEGNSIVERTERYSLNSIIENFSKNEKDQSVAIKDFNKEINDAGQHVSVWEKKQAEIREIDLRSAEKFQKTIDDGAIKSSKFWETMSNSSEVQKNMTETIKMGIDAQYLWMITSGIEKNPAAIKDYLERLKEETYEKAGVDPSKLTENERYNVLKKGGYKEIERQVIDAGAMPDEMKTKIPPRTKPPEQGANWDRPGHSSLFEEDMRIPEAYRNEPQRQTSEVNKELIARVEGLETLNRTIDVLINRFDSLGDEIRLASLGQKNIKVKVESNDDNVYSQQTNFLDSRA